MSGMLASVNTLPEARLALAAGADIIDLKEPAAGALGALPCWQVCEIVAAIGADRPVSATVGDLPMEPARVHDAVAAMAETGVDYVKVGLFPAPRRIDCIAALQPLCEAGVRVVWVMFADRQPDFALVPLIAESGCCGVMLDTAGKHSGGLRDCLDHQQLHAFVRQARTWGLLVGLAGSLRAADIAPLLPLDADYLGFRGALCNDSVRTGALDPAAVTHIRSLIPSSATGAFASSRVAASAG